MAVYVDDARAPYGRMKLCHMVADSREELLAMAEKLGVARKWLQHDGEGVTREHFDVCLSKRERAVTFGAIAVTTRELVQWRKSTMASHV